MQFRWCRGSIVSVIVILIYQPPIEVMFQQSQIHLYYLYASVVSVFFVLFCIWNEVKNKKTIVDQEMILRVELDHMKQELSLCLHRNPCCSIQLFNSAKLRRY